MTNKIILPALFALICSASAVAKEQAPHSFATAKDFTVWRASDQVHYVMGLADAFTFLSAKTGHQRGLSECYRKFDVSMTSLAVSFEGYIKRPIAYNRNFTGPDPKTLPAAEVFDKFSSLSCKDERHGK